MATEHPGDDNPIEEILLTGFPNPERVGCPTPQVIRSLAEKKLGRDNPAWRHIWNCSPCFKDFKEIRDQRLAHLEQERRSQKIRRLVVLACGALACIAILLIYTRHIPLSKNEVATVEIDLTNAGTFRGSPDDDGRVLASLPNKLDELHLTLPRFSRQGRYVVAILESQSQNTAVALGSAISSGDVKKTLLTLKLDLSSTKPGRYFLATRHEEQGQSDAAYYYPVLVGQQ